MRTTFMLALLALLALLVAAPLPAATLDGWFGTYTTNQGAASGSVGIYGFQWDTDAGSLHALHAAAPTSNPSFLALHPNGRFLYAVNEGAGNEGGGSAKADRISAFAIGDQGAAGELAPLGSVSSMGKGPCYLTVDATGRWLFAANYQSGTIAVYAIQSDGRLSEARQTIQQQGAGPVADRQQSAHAHEAVPSPDGRFLLVPDLGADRIFIYQFDAASGTLRPNQTAAAVMPPGYGPRHLVFSKDARLVYVVTELADRIMTMRWDASAGVLTPLAETPALPPNFTGQRSGAEIALHPSGKFLYSSSRGDSNTIAIFRIGADGVPVPAASVPSGGRTPRFFGIDPSGHFLIATNQDSSNVVIFRIDPDTGMLHSQGEPLSVPAPVDFVFARQAPDPTAAGRATFESRCSGCHGADGNGGELGPAIAWRLSALTDTQLQTTVQGGLPTRGMPANDVSNADLPPLIAFLRSLRPRQPGFQPYRTQVQLVGGAMLDGLMLAESFEDAQLRTDDHQLHLLRRTDGPRFREVTSEVDWSTYNGDITGNRYTKLSQITKANLRRVAPRWVFHVPNASSLQGTPVVANGVMYVTNSNECYALDAGSGREIWHYRRPRTTGLIGNGASGANRGVALAGDKVYMVTDNAHLLALNRADGTMAWETELADWHKNYGSTSAPLIVGKLVIVGSAGGEEGARGFLAAFDQSTGKEVWRFWTVPLPGEPGSETWAGKGIEHGGATAWFTGVYDAETDTLFWPTGNPGEDYNGDERGGDDLYSDCILALDPNTGKLKWHYQTTPHDLWDWDASETPLVIDANWQGKPRQLLVQGNRNGFFYVLDRTDGKLLLGKPFIKELTWASGIGADGKPVKVAGQEPSESGTRVCPSQDGATNWYSPSYNPATGLFYMQTNEMCSIYMKRSVTFEYGKPFLGGAQSTDRKSPAVRILRALDLQTGTVKWELPEVGTATSWGGTLSTATGLVFFGEDSGTFAAADAVTGKPLWSFEAGAAWHASPMAYQFDGQELIAVAGGGSIFAFGLLP